MSGDILLASVTLLFIQKWSPINGMTITCCSIINKNFKGKKKNLQQIKVFDPYSIYVLHEASLYILSLTPTNH